VQLLDVTVGRRGLGVASRCRSVLVKHFEEKPTNVAYSIPKLNWLIVTFCEDALEYRIRLAVRNVLFWPFHRNSICPFAPDVATGFGG
jgi:hypothetical protein